MQNDYAAKKKKKKKKKKKNERKLFHKFIQAKIKQAYLIYKTSVNLFRDFERYFAYCIVWRCVLSFVTLFL